MPIEKSSYLKALRAAREDQDLSYGVLAIKITEAREGQSIYRGHLSRIERGTRTASPELLHVWAKVLGLDPVQLGMPPLPARPTPVRGPSRNRSNWEEAAEAIPCSVTFLRTNSARLPKLKIGTTVTFLPEHIEQIRRMFSTPPDETLLSAARDDDELRPAGWDRKR